MLACGLLLWSSRAWAAAAAGAVQAAQQQTIRLRVPFPITGPRDVQGTERATRAYRAVAPHAPQPLTEALADVAVMAMAKAPGVRIIRLRRPRTENDLGPERMDADPAHPPDLVLLSHEALFARERDAARGARQDDGVTAAAAPVVLAPLASMPLALIVSPATLESILGGPQARARRAGRPVRLGSAGERSASRVAGALLSRTLGWPLLHVAYNGGHAALNGWIRTEIDAVFLALPLVLPYVENGRLPVLGLASRQRFELLPQLPTLAESGLDLVWEGWFGLYASRRMAPHLREQLRALVQDRLGSASVRSALLLRGLVPAAADIDEFAARVRAEHALAVDAISTAGP